MKSTTPKKGSEVFYYPKELPERLKLLPQSIGYRTKSGVKRGDLVKYSIVLRKKLRK